jgi:hypothetical protein
MNQIPQTLPLIQCSCHRPLSCLWFRFQDTYKRIAAASGLAPGETQYVSGSMKETVGAKALKEIGLGDAYPCCRTELLTRVV